MHLIRPSQSSHESGKHLAWLNNRFKTSEYSFNCFVFVMVSLSPHEDSSDFLSIKILSILCRMQSFFNFSKSKPDTKLLIFIISSSNPYYTEPYISYTSDTFWLNLCHRGALFYGFKQRKKWNPVQRKPR
jgi:hypothetical protein